MNGRVLVVAGEPSGDRTLSTVVRALGRPTFGIGGDALAAEGTELVAHVRDLSAMGAVEIVRGLPLIARAIARVLAVVRSERPRLAILASWSTANGRLAPLLRRAGVRVAWISPPEIWAWRPGRAARLALAADRLIVTLPFEQALWQRAGADAHYVGHPVLDVPRRNPPRRGVAILPGSRRAEIERLLDPMIAAAPHGEILVAPSLAPDLRARIARTGLKITDATEGAGPLLERFERALVASGTASLEAAAMGTPPVIAYALHPLTYGIARRLVRTRSIALPNVVLERGGHPAAFPELLQDAVTPADLRRALVATPRDACETVRSLLGSGPFAARAARLVEELDEVCPIDG